MRWFGLMGFLMMMVLFGSGCSGISKIRPTKTVALAELQSDAQRLAPEIFKDGLVIHVKAGEKVPLNLVTDLLFAELVPGENQVTFKKDVYFFISKNTMMVSPDGISYAPIYKFKSVRKLFGAGRGGTFNIGFGVTKDTGLVISVAASVQ